MHLPAPVIAPILATAFRPVLFAVYWLVGFMPRDRARWVFGSWDGQRFTDNAAALFRHVARHGRDDGIQPIWISHDRGIVASLREQGFVAHHVLSPGGIVACATAGVFVFSGLTKDVNHWLSRGACRVLLRHGVGVKKIERAIDTPSHRLFKLFHGNPLERFFWTCLLPWHTVRPDFAIATSAEHARQGELFFGIPAEAIAITGFPRNDELLAGGTPALPPDASAWLAEARALRRPVFLYLPTFRDDGARLAFDWAELDAAAVKAGVRLLVKLHFVDARRGLDRDRKAHSNLLVADSSLDPNVLFPAVDGLVSDFSSVVYDFLLTRKPVVFFVPDYAEYLKSRSLYFDFEEVTPGAKARTLAELSPALAEAAREGRGRWTAQYEEVLARFHVYRDGGACGRVYREIVRRCVRPERGA